MGLIESLLPLLLFFSFRRLDFFDLDFFDFFFLRDLRLDPSLELSEFADEDEESVELIEESDDEDDDDDDLFRLDCRPLLKEINISEK